MNNLKQLFSPKSVAVIGASRDSQKIGHLIFKNLLDYNFAGRAYPVNPQCQTLLGHQVFASVLDLPEVVDLAIIVVPANIVPTVLEEVGLSGTKTVIVVSAGFAETGSSGQDKQDLVVNLAQKYELRILGPNCLGIINPHLGLNASWGEAMPKQGRIAFASQSGALAAPVIELINETGLGFSYFASLGNKADINEVDLLEFFSQDRNTDFILFYLESFKNGKRFLDLVKKTTTKKPLIVLKSGQTALGAKSAQSHTASLATPQKVTEGVFSQTNIIAANSVEEMINLAKLLTGLKGKKPGKTVAIVTNAGGPGVLTTDAVVQNGLLIASLSPKTIKALIKVLPKEAGLNNPIDLLGNADAETYFKASQIILADQEVDNLIVILTKQRGTDVEAIAHKLTQIKTKKPIIPIFMGGESVKTAKEIFQKNKLVNFSAPKDVAISLSRAVAWQEKAKEKPKANNNKINGQKIKEIINKTTQTRLNEAEGFEILANCQIAVPAFAKFKNKEQGLAILEKIGLPAFLKVLSPELLHKTELGAVQKVTSQESFLKHFNIMGGLFDSPEFILTEAVEGEIELIVGVKQDSNFGHLIMVGAGGIYTEVWQDQVFRALPINQNDAQAMLSELKIYPILKGARGKTGVNLNKIEEVLLAIAKLIEVAPRVDQLDINPLIVNKEVAVAVDVKISFLG